MSDVSKRNRQSGGQPTGGQFATEARGTDTGVSLGGDLATADTEQVGPRGPFRMTSDMGYKKRYKFPEVTVDMPSRASVAKVAENVGANRDIQFPVALKRNNRSDEGVLWSQAIASRAENGRWRVTVTDLDGNPYGGHTQKMTSEAVCSVLEARRVRHDPSEIASLRDKHLLRAAGQHVPTKVTGSWIEEMSYNPATNVMTVKMPGYNKKNGKRRIYGYTGVTDEEAAETLSSGSTGRAYNQLIKKGHGTIPVAECDDCGSVHPEGSHHVCE